ncbi:uncharacterized protein LOC108252137 [Diaphorina citri]|uniref:Uncharacterized protein LOC108252137 n=1 Tax=Diaphorina citri TaxID=121845 RepID=A0A1S4E916_DIACI|nr:uncharacterized protein LOC108252137 [Diaphorina citri]
MNYTLQVHGERHVYPVPPGLNELVSDITREVLRHQPDNLYKFIAEYLESLLRIRNAMNVGVKFRAQVIEESTAFVNHFLVCGFSPDDLDAAARKIQSFWRGFLGRKKLREDLEQKKREEEAFDETVRAIAEDLNVTLDELLNAANILQKYLKEFLATLLQAPSEQEESDVSSADLERQLGSWVRSGLRKQGIGSADDQSLTDDQKIMKKFDSLMDHVDAVLADEISDDEDEDVEGAVGDGHWSEDEIPAAEEEVAGDAGEGEMRPEDVQSEVEGDVENAEQ